MINRKSTFFIGIFILCIPFLGVPTFWKTVFIIISGFALIFVSIKITLPKKTAKMRVRKERSTPVFVENIPVYEQNAVNPNSDIKINSTKNSDIK